jgi:hypothetical protein
MIVEGLYGAAMTTADPDRPGDRYRELAQRVAGVLAEAPTWQLDDASVNALHGVLSDIARASVDRDIATLRSANGKLLMLTSHRLSRVGDPDPVPPQRLPLEWINDLVHTLRADPDPSSEPAPRNSANADPD